MNVDRRELDAVDALANHHRREIIYLVGLQPCSISYLAQVCDLSLPAIHKHIKILEAAGMVTRRSVGQTNVLTLHHPFDPLQLRVRVTQILGRTIQRSQTDLHRAQCRSSSCRVG